MKKIIMLLVLIILLSGCSNKNIENINEVKENKDVQPMIELQPSNKVKNDLTEVDYMKVKVNEIGNIPVIMYHGIVTKEPSSVYQITVEQFKNDLQYFYDNKYRPIKLRDFLDSNIDVGLGCTPIVLTFDDGLGIDRKDSLGIEFALENKNGKLVPVKNSAVQIMDDFAKEHPDFGKAAVFYINGGKNQFCGEGTLADRLNYLLDNGYEIGNHTQNHANLKKVTKDKLLYQICEVEKNVREVLGKNVMFSFSYPFGQRPINKELDKYVLEGKCNDIEYNYDIAFKEGPSMQLVPAAHKDFNPINAPRLRGNKGEKNNQDMWGYLKRYERYPQRKYISDGDSDTIVVPKDKEKYINKEKILDKKLIVY